MSRTAGSDYHVIFDFNQPPERLGTFPQQLSFEEFVEPTSRDGTTRRPSEHDPVPPGLQVPSSACRREGPALRSAP
jgi:hypothetical protein